MTEEVNNMDEKQFDKFLDYRNQLFSGLSLEKDTLYTYFALPDANGEMRPFKRYVDKSEPTKALDDIAVGLLKEDGIASERLVEKLTLRTDASMDDIKKINRQVDKAYRRMGHVFDREEMEKFTDDQMVKGLVYCLKNYEYERNMRLLDIEYRDAKYEQCVKLADSNGNQTSLNSGSDCNYLVIERLDISDAGQETLKALDTVLKNREKKMAELEAENPGQKDWKEYGDFSKVLYLNGRRFKRENLLGRAEKMEAQKNRETLRARIKPLSRNKRNMLTKDGNERGGRSL